MIATPKAAALSGGAAPSEDADKKTKKAAADPSFMQYYEAALAEERRLVSEKDALREYSKQQELAYWQTLLSQAQLSSADRLAIGRKVSALEVEVRREDVVTREGVPKHVQKTQRSRGNEDRPRVGRRQRV
jgi:hypothetical protein